MPTDLSEENDHLSLSRRYLLAASTAGVAAVAGCSDNGDEEGLNELEAENERLEERVEELEAENERLEERVEQAESQYETLEPLPIGRYDDGVYLNQDNEEFRVTALACTGSMKPTFHCDDLLILDTDPSKSDIKEGDMMGYSVPEEFEGECGEGFTHRITEIYESDGTTYYQLEGDNASREDPCGIPFSWFNYKIVGILYDVGPGENQQNRLPTDIIS